MQGLQQLMPKADLPCLGIEADLRRLFIDQFSPDSIVSSEAPHSSGFTCCLPLKALGSIVLMCAVACMPKCVLSCMPQRTHSCYPLYALLSGLEFL